ncbi:ABC transporter substrate-binding protein [Methylobacterium sp. J-001]|jgi:hypothetical protein|uniref:ABC transporter substrate-binding protein n=1 Tax=Methylobacterium sp. J-001 TaxID=2836609 RepID=UPI001FBB8247|nr:ABC transporter substrate-binding protein [Methylobacterium sp. J-001]MCJ2120227.1 ABC transporter substrate-binding protein [Methylobacterium sp. J-001]
MVDTWSVSDDRLTWRFTLRDGLRFHDGAPVRAADCVASLKRWAARGALGGRLMDVTTGLEAVDDRTVVLTLRAPMHVERAGAAYRAPHLRQLSDRRDASRACRADLSSKNALFRRTIAWSGSQLA